MRPISSAATPDLRGVKEDRAGGDDANRPGFLADPSDLGPAGAAVHAVHRELIGVRRRNPLVHAARTEVLSLANERIVYRSAGEGSCRGGAESRPGPAGVPPGAAVLLAGNAPVRESRNRVALLGRRWAVPGNADS